MNIDSLKQQAAEAAITEVTDGMIVGIGTGSTVNFFIDALASIRHRIEGAVASSVASRERLSAVGIPILELNTTGNLPLYVDGADEATRHRALYNGTICDTTNSRCIDDYFRPVTALGTKTADH